LTERLRTTICPLPLLLLFLPQSLLPLFKNLPPSTTYWDPTPPSIFHWTKVPVFNNSSSSSVNSVQVASTLLNDTDLLDCPFISLLHYLPKTKPTKQYMLTPYFSTITGEGKPLQFCIWQLLDKFWYTPMQILQLAIPSKILLNFRYSLVEGVELDLPLTSTALKMKLSNLVTLYTLWWTFLHTQWISLHRSTQHCQLEDRSDIIIGTW